MQNEPSTKTSSASFPPSPLRDTLGNVVPQTESTPCESHAVSATQPAKEPLAVRHREIWVTASFVGLHQWTDANDEVSYLRDLHRHKFGVKVRHPVTHPDRQVEFHIFQQKVLAACTLVRRELVTRPEMSCEMMAEAIGNLLIGAGWLPSSVSVDEDGECGATIYFG